MGATKNIFSGIIQAIISLASYVVIPWIGLTVVKTLALPFGVTIELFRQRVDDILFYIIAMGIIQTGIAFAKGSSPKYSKRRAIFSLFNLLGAASYSYIIKFSGLSQIPITLTNVGEITISLDAFVFFVFGIVVLNSLLAIFDLAIAIKDQRKGMVYSLDKERKAELVAAENLGVKV
ncbi:MAG: hypothetical protein JW839_14995 [Candidatus Lokiarchaeota archaeon]|nr:hypothetical protein [Candidatus Lokiarchaeota archaeon]